MDNIGSQISAVENHSVTDGSGGSTGTVGLDLQGTLQILSAFGTNGAEENGEVYGITGS